LRGTMSSAPFTKNGKHPINRKECD
jgi:hypothetical protein